MMRGQARSSLTIKGVDNLMIAETVPVHHHTPPNPARTGQSDRNINYAGALGAGPFSCWATAAAQDQHCGHGDSHGRFDWCAVR